MTTSVRLDFSRPIGLFPLPAVALYPHTLEGLVAFEPRYRQLVEDCLRARGDGPLLEAAPIAMATYAGRGWTGERIGEPALRPVVCVGKIVEHRELPDGRHRIALHGLCRARIESIAEPEGRRLYRLARLAPLEPPSTKGARRLPMLERELGELLSSGQLRRMHGLDPVRDWIARGKVPTDILVEQLAAILSRGDEQRYALLAEPSGRARARFVLSELSYLSRVLDRASERTPASARRGVNAN